VFSGARGSDAMNAAWRKQAATAVQDDQVRFDYQYVITANLLLIVTSMYAQRPAWPACVRLLVATARSLLKRSHNHPALLYDLLTSPEMVFVHSPS
jgi:hypothetical protein